MSFVLKELAWTADKRDGSRCGVGRFHDRCIVHKEEMVTAFDWLQSWKCMRMWGVAVSGGSVDSELIQAPTCIQECERSVVN